ncbi:hypothetical protein [Kitasatospora sp. GP82]|uniref:hypothetical protein n=1 Tax=Kitasatospora sp. GP82 TaxID=3035089 RepID=UPI002474CE7F|nr:hypothetical protein [Kitasatospora sp. GP82]MDH6126073.1 hypothetical protein [Kitasatospora sp. GP82]
MDDFREVLSEELSSLGAQPPALGDLVGEATRAGRRVRRVRMWAAVGGSAVAMAAVGVLLSVLVTGGVKGGGGVAAAGPASSSPALSASPSGGVPSGSSASASSSAAPSSGATVTRTAPPAPPPGKAGGGKVRATAAGLLEEVLQLLPAGSTSNYAGDSGAVPLVQTYLTTAAGTGMIRLSVFSEQVPMDCAGAAECLTDPYGHKARVDHEAGNCVQDTVVQVDHGDGTSVQVDIGTCLDYTDSHNAPGVQALTVQQAVAIAGNPALGPLMDSATVQAGEGRFPDLPSIG